MAKRWRCMVCGYTHQGASPPEACLVCGVGAEKFAQVVIKEGDEPLPAASRGLLQEMTHFFMPHAVAAHFPNALLPTLSLFLLLCCFLGFKTLDQGIYLLLGVIFLSTLVTLGTGIYSWRNHYEGARSRVFHRKLLFGVCLVLICAEMLLLRYQYPELLTDPSGVTWFFLSLAVAAICCVTLLGHYGGMLVFGHIEKNRGHWD